MMRDADVRKILDTSKIWEEILLEIGGFEGRDLDSALEKLDAALMTVSLTAYHLELQRRELAQ